MPLTKRNMCTWQLLQFQAKIKYNLNNICYILGALSWSRALQRTKQLRDDASWFSCILRREWNDYIWSRTKSIDLIQFPPTCWAFFNLHKAVGAAGSVLRSCCPFAFFFNQHLSYFITLGQLGFLQCADWVGCPLCFGQSCEIKVTVLCFINGISVLRLAKL